MRLARWIQQFRSMPGNGTPPTPPTLLLIQSGQSVVGADSDFVPVDLGLNPGSAPFAICSPIYLAGSDLNTPYFPGASVDNAVTWLWFISAPSVYSLRILNGKSTDVTVNWSVYITVP